jgi:hypothetical protein
VHVTTRGRHRFATRVGQAVHRGAARRRPRTTIAATLVVGLVAAACSSGTEAGVEEVIATFERAEGSSLSFDEPIATVSDLIGPATEDDGWTIVGSMFDPTTQASVATVWTSENAREWDRRAVSAASPGTGESMAAATSTDDGLLAVGRHGDGQKADAAIWYEDDGDWRMSRPDAMAGDHEQWAFAVAHGEGGTLVAGGENVWGEIRPRLWLSTDGESWKTVDGGPGGPLDATGEESIRDVAAFGSGFVAVGSRTIDNDQDGVVWFSPDGEDWEEMDVPTMGGDGRQEARSVVSIGGEVVAGGFVEGSGGQGRPAVWRSRDGRTWGDTRTDLPMTDQRNAASDLVVRSLSVGEGGSLVAAGGNDWRPRVWRSTDAGVSWEELPDPVHGEMFQDGVALRDAVSADGVTVALGAEPSVLLLAGARWEDATGDEFPKGGTQPFATSVAAGPEGVIAAGGQYTAGSGQTRERYVGQVWRDSDGTWEAVESEMLSAGHIMDLTAFEGGYAAVGFEDFGLAHERGFVSDAEPDGIVWISENGTDWARIGTADARIDDEYLQFLEDPSPEQAEIIVGIELEAPPHSVAPAGGDGTRSLSAVAPLAAGYIAVGSVYKAGDADPIIITSTDGLAFSGETPAHAGDGIQRYSDVCVGPDGDALAVGISGTNSNYDVAVATRTGDGSWAKSSDDSFGGPGNQQANACAASDDGFVVVGSDDRSGSIDARIWTSEDGTEWSEVTSGLLGGLGDQWASAVTAVPGGGWLVAGTDASTGSGDIALWLVGPDGEVERRDRGEPALGGPGEQSVSTVIIDDDERVLLAGSDYGRVGLWQSDSLGR